MVKVADLHLPLPVSPRLEEDVAGLQVAVDWRAERRFLEQRILCTGCPVLLFATLKQNSVISKSDKTILYTAN